MTVEQFEHALARDLAELEASGRAKGAETVIAGMIPGAGERGPRYLLAGMGDRPFLRMNSNGYLGLAAHPLVRRAEEEAVREYGVGPGAVRFISGTWAPHVALESALAAFHGRPAAMIFSSAYATVMGTLVPLITPETAVISDALNHNCIINAVRLGSPKEKHIYPHLDLAAMGCSPCAETPRRSRRSWASPGPSILYSPKA
jgi:glycine C-acetyltransferase